MVAAARKEGRVVVYARPQNDYYSAFKDFESAFPGTKVEYVSMSDASARIMAERRAGRYIPDVYISGMGSSAASLRTQRVFQALRSALILPEVLDGAKWFEGKLWFADKEEEYFFMFGLDAGKIVAINTQLVHPKEITSFRQLLDTKWRGKIVSHDILKGGTGSTMIRFLYLHPQLGPDFLRMLFRDQDITFSHDQRQMADWLGRGRFSVSLFPRTMEIFRARDAGLPVGIPDPRMKEGYPAVAGGSHIALMSPSPHLNAAKVFLNWFLSRDVQATLERLGGEPSLRVDTPTKDLVEHLAPRKGDNYMVVGLERYWYLDKEIGELLKTLRK